MVDFECPFCRKLQVVTVDNSRSSDVKLAVGKSKFGDLLLRVKASRCLPPDCGETKLRAALHVVNLTPDRTQLRIEKTLHKWNLLPRSSSKPQPDYIPEAIRQDYYEACLIKDLSPKSSATLIRRCLQGMIRDFCNIRRDRLIDEIRELRRLADEDKLPSGVTHESIDGIDHVRDIGNIGAHMEKDINVIIDVDPDEAEVLIELAETLLEEWYIERHNRQERFKNLGAIAAQKKVLKGHAPKKEG